MKDKKVDYNFSFIRAFFCIAVLFYHLEILKGGYLAVCSLFVIAGYFSTISLTQKNKLLPYYKKRLIRIYPSLIIVVLTTLSIITFLNINILSIKPEIKSLLLSYNNYWQLSVNSDYFSKHITSPYIHLWYMSILIQIQLCFPIVYIVLKKIEDKTNKNIVCIILFLLTILSTIYFYYISITKDIMITYYDTLSRMFSFMFGAFLGSFHIHYNKLFMIRKNKNFSLIMYYIYIVILMLLFIFIKPSSKFFNIAMILTTFITTRLIEYGISIYKNNKRLDNKIIKFISDISYEIYLVQYPIIFFFGYLKINSFLKLILIIITVLLTSWLIKTSQVIKKDKLKYFKIFIRIIIISLTIYGLYQFIILKDHTKEMEQLKESIEIKEEIIRKKQKEYKQKQQEEQKNWENYLNSLEIDEKKLQEYVTNLKIVGIGDSIMINPVNSLYNEFPNGYFDAKINRTVCAGADVLQEIKDSGITWDALVFNLGTNGYPNDKCKNKIMEVAGDTKVFWLNATHADYDNNNSELEKYASNHNNIHILDWVSITKQHPEYLYSDGIHLKPNASQPYASFIKNEIYKEYLNEQKRQKDETIKKAIDNKKEQITFYGNDLLTNIFDTLQKKYPDSKFEAKSDINIDKIIKDIKKEKEQKTLNKKLFFIFDNKTKITKEDYKSIIELCKDSTIYIISTSNIELNYNNVEIINLNLTKNDYVEDNIHLTKKANKKLIKEIEKVLEK